jgi:hypothetical protein
MKVLIIIWHYTQHLRIILKVECGKHRVVQNKVDVFCGLAKGTPKHPIALSHWSPCYRYTEPTHRALESKHPTHVKVGFMCISMGPFQSAIVPMWLSRYRVPHLNRATDRNS